MYNMEETRSQSKTACISSCKHCDNNRNGKNFLDPTETTWVLSLLPVFLCLVIHMEPIFLFWELKSYLWKHEASVHYEFCAPLFGMNIQRFQLASSLYLLYVSLFIATIASYHEVPNSS